MLSQHSPFADIHPLQRNREVQEDRRPTLQARETRSLIQLQEIMRMCWEKEPDSRPTMSQVVEWIRAPEFERLRAEISLRGVKSISCACVCRILPEHETGDDLMVPPEDGEDKMASLGEFNIDRELDRIMEKYGGVKPGVGEHSNRLFPNMPSISVDIEGQRGGRAGEREGGGGGGGGRGNQEGYPFPLSKTRSFYKMGRKGSLADRSGKQLRGGAEPEGKAWQGDQSKEGEEEGMRGKFEPYTQIWMCGRDNRKGLLQIFTYNDGHPKCYVR